VAEKSLRLRQYNAEPQIIVALFLSDRGKQDFGETQIGSASLKATIINTNPSAFRPLLDRQSTFA